MWLLIPPLLLCLIFVYLLANKQSIADKKIKRRFDTSLPVEIKALNTHSKLSEFTSKIANTLSNYYGVNFQGEWIGKFLLLITLVFIIAYIFFSIKVTVTIVLAFTAISLIYFIYRQHKNKKLIIAQIPLFIDQLIRSLGTGRSLEAAIRLVTQETSIPLRLLLEKVVRATDVGAEFTETLIKEATLNRINELQIIALSIKMSNSYGSSPKDMLTSVMQMINNQDQARRELAAMTGETKISAIILTLTPISILLFMMLMNPGYLDMMTANSSGRTLLWVAAGMQLTGVVLFWRMLKSL
jgi:tight adherence protein B